MIGQTLIEKSSIFDMLVVAFDFDSDAILLGYPRYAEHTKRLHRHHLKVKNSSLSAYHKWSRIAYSAQLENSFPKFEIEPLPRFFTSLMLTCLSIPTSFTSNPKTCLLTLRATIYSLLRVWITAWANGGWPTEANKYSRGKTIKMRMCQLILVGLIKLWWEYISLEMRDLFGGESRIGTRSINDSRHRSQFERAFS